jgi:hypothetical protein
MSTAAQVPFFDQIGFTKVVWLDDLFEVKAAPTTVEIVAAVASAQAGGRMAAHSKLTDLSGEDSPQEWAKQIETRLSETEVLEYLGQIKAPEPPRESAAADYDRGEMQEVASALGSKVECLGFTQWAAAKETLIANAGSGVFLVDRERIEGGERTARGDEIVKELIDRCPAEAVVVVLTHSVPAEGTEGLRQHLATELSIPVTRLGVVSKRPGGGVSLTNGIRAAVRITLTQLTCAVILERMVTVMSETMTATKKTLSELPVSALDRAIFENSFTEGASEIDVFCRILLSRQRAAVDADVAGALDEVHSPLARMRKLRLLEPMPDLPDVEAELLREWRREEVFDPGDRLNAMRSPLVGGDVFLKDGTQRYYVLLGQPCDLIVRPQGTRVAYEAVLVRLATSYVPKAGSEGRFFEVPALQGTNRWALDFREWSSVNLECLEWTSFNKDGRVAFSIAEERTIGLLPGWEGRLSRSRARFAKGKQYCLSIGKLAGSMATATETTVEFPYRRVARLRSPRASGAYAAFVSFQARAAFDHDFAEGVGENKAEEAVSQPAGEKANE